MRAFTVFLGLFALFAMAAARGVNYVNNPSDPTAVHVVDNAPGQDILNNPDPAFGQPDQSTGILINPDPAFGRPTYEQPDISPAWAPNSGPPRYPGKQYDNPYARGGK